MKTFAEIESAAKNLPPSDREKLVRSLSSESRDACGKSRPVQVGSHYHFFEANAGLSFERARARGMRLDIAAGTAMRFEPGQTREVRLIPLSGDRIVHGFRQQVMGAL